MRGETLAAVSQLIEDRAIVRLYRAVSGDGTATYLAHVARYNCPAGVAGRACYHRAGALMLAHGASTPETGEADRRGAGVR